MGLQRNLETPPPPPQVQADSAPEEKNHVQQTNPATDKARSAAAAGELRRAGAGVSRRQGSAGVLQRERKVRLPPQQGRPGQLQTRAALSGALTRRRRPSPHHSATSRRVC